MILRFLRRFRKPPPAHVRTACISGQRAVSSEHSQFTIHNSQFTISSMFVPSRCELEQVGQSGTKIGVFRGSGYNLCHFYQRSGCKTYVYTVSTSISYVSTGNFRCRVSGTPKDPLHPPDPRSKWRDPLRTRIMQIRRMALNCHGFQAVDQGRKPKSRRRLAADERLLSHAPHAPGDEFSRRAAETPRHKLSWVSVRYVYSPRTKVLWQNILTFFRYAEPSESDARPDAARNRRTAPMLQMQF